VKLTAVAIVIALIIIALAFYPEASERGNSFSGEIMDSQCAQMGSHQAMMLSHDFTTALECALFCAHSQDPRSKFVLFDPATKTTYQLDDQDRAQLYAAEKVTVTGTYDKSTKTIEVANIQAKP
jgi:hypothetical protein